MRRLALTLAAIAALTAPALAADPIGKVDRVQGDATGTNSATPAPLSTGADIFLNEIVATGADARLALGFADGTELTLGENAKVTIDTFVYQPAGASQLHAAVAGAFRYISGKLAPGATRDASVTTPIATIGVRGTDFWGGPIDGQFGVVLLEGSVTVTTPSGTASLLEAGQGVNINGAAMSGVTTWPDDKRNRALATVAFQ